jgi:Rieske Fe-S protein
MTFSQLSRRSAPWLIVLLLAACGSKENTVKGGYVDVVMYTSDPSFFPLNSINGWTYYNSGSSGLKGLIIFRLTQDDFVAFDRTCTYDPDASCALVEVESSGITAVDSCCGSRYQITDGSVIEGPATQPLIRYRTSFDGTILHVYN